MNKNGNQSPFWKDKKTQTKTKQKNKKKQSLARLFKKQLLSFQGYSLTHAKEKAFQKKKFIHFDRNSQTSSSQLQQMAIQKTEDVCLWLIRLCKRLWEFEIELSTDLIPHRWEWSHLHMAKGLMVMWVCKAILAIDQEVRGNRHIFREKLQDVDV